VKPVRLEIIDPNVRLGGITHAIFDFDGTLSLIREGWQQVMEPMFVDELAALDAGEDVESLRRLVAEFVARLTGKQTIYQMFELVDQIRRRGGSPRDPLEYKHEYLRRLERRISDRIEGLSSGRLKPDQFLVPGAVDFLQGLRKRGIALCLASGTDEPFVKREAELLGLTAFFDGGVFGALDDYKSFSKKLVIDRIIREHRLSGRELLGVGDGFVEIENTRQVGGVALGVPVKEDEPTVIDAWKRRRLIEAGAQLLTPNFADSETLLAYLFP
jgi:phosphoglycolate phosphatase-like HAD superfamily hydrolase